MMDEKGKQEKPGTGEGKAGAEIGDYYKISPGPVTGATKLEGVRIDFNFGARVRVPAGTWRVRIIDLASCYVAVDREASDEIVESDVRYYVPWRVEVWQGEEMVFAHRMDLKGQKVHVKFCSDALGDSLAWIPFVREFREKHGCEICISMNPVMGNFLKTFYPEFRFIGPSERPAGCYASYYIGCFFPPEDRTLQPSSWKVAGFQGVAANILGLPEGPRCPDIRREVPRTVREPYVCIAAQSTGQLKYWNNPEGWLTTVQWLREQGYRVLCIDKERTYGAGWRQNVIPWGAEDFTGNRPLEERLDLLLHADFFVGLSSGLAWLAWGAGIPVVLISGFTIPHSEFPTPYRIINFHACTGCWEDDTCEFRHEEFVWCPRHQDDPERQFECTRKITSAQVIQACRRVMEDHGLRPKQGQS